MSCHVPRLTCSVTLYVPRGKSLPSLNVCAAVPNEERRTIESRITLPSRSWKTQRIGRGWYAQRAKRAVADDRLDVDRLAGAVNAALGEHRGGDGQAVHTPRRADIEPPGREVTGPRVDRDNGPIERQASGDISREPALLTLVVGASRVTQTAQSDEALCVRRASGSDAAGGIAQLDVDTGFGNPILDASDPDDGLFLPDARRNA